MKHLIIWRDFISNKLKSLASGQKDLKLTILYRLKLITVKFLTSMWVLFYGLKYFCLFPAQCDTLLLK